MSSPLLIVSADGHATAEPETFRPYLDRRHHRDLDALVEEDQAHRDHLRTFFTFPDEVLATIDGSGAIRAGGLEGAQDVSRRLAEMDREGVAAEILISGAQTATLPWFATTNRPHPIELQAAGTRAYNRWIADCLVEGGGRLFAVGYPGPAQDVAAMVEEVAWLAAHGFRSITVPGLVVNEGDLSLTDPALEPFWAAVADQGLVLSVHAGHGRPQGVTIEFLDRIQRQTAGLGRDAALRALSEDRDSPFALDMRPRRVLWQLMLAGVFDRHPGLRLALTEVRGDWVPATLAHLDGQHASGELQLARKPSDYWRRHCVVGLSFIHRAEVEMRHEIGVDQMLFGRDYPHPEGTWPNTPEWIAHAFAGVDEAEVRAILGLNAVRTYGLDLDHLTTVADAVGLPISSLASTRAVEPALVEEFDVRGGYLKPAEQVDTGLIDRLVAEDLQVAGAGR